MKPLQLFLILLALSPASPAAILAEYLTGTNSTAAANVLTGISATSASFSGSSEWRTTYGSPGATPAGPNLGTSSGSNWRLFQASTTPATPASGSSSVRATLTSTSDPFTPAALSFDLAIAIHNNQAPSITTTFAIYINGVALDSSLISPAPSLTKTANSSYLVQTFTADLSELGPLTSLQYEIALADDYTTTTGNIGNFIQGIRIQGDIIPEPGAPLLVLSSLGGLCMSRTRRRNR